MDEGPDHQQMRHMWYPKQVETDQMRNAQGAGVMSKKSE
jgi:hypothetical protein